LYEIRNNINNMIYVGVHKTKNMDDGYMGSGSELHKAYKEFGIENFSKRILETFDTSESMFNREKEIVNEEFLLRTDVYNKRRGGYGGFDYINKHSKNFKLTPNESSKGGKSRMAQLTPEERSQLGKLGNSSVKNPNYWTALSVANSPEAIAKKKLTWQRTGRGKGEKGSQFGTMWITNGIENKKIKKSDDIPNGWSKGRIIKV